MCLYKTSLPATNFNAHIVRGNSACKYKIQNMDFKQQLNITFKFQKQKYLYTT